MGCKLCLNKNVMNIAIVSRGQTIGDVVINQTGDLANWDAILTANSFIEWVPILATGQQLTIPDTIQKNLNNVRQFKQYELNNSSVPNVYTQIENIFALLI